MKQLLLIQLLAVVMWSAPAAAQKSQPPALYPVQQGSLYGYIDRAGKVVVPIEYGGARHFSEGMAAAGKGSRWGYLRDTGELSVPLQYSSAGDFSEGLAAVSAGKKYGFIDKTGKLVIPLRFDFAGAFHDGRARVQVNGLYGYIDHAAVLVIPAAYYSALDFSEGLAAVVPGDGDKYGFIDQKGVMVIPPQFNLAAGFSEGMAAVKIGAKWGGIDKTGKIVISPLLVNEFRFAEGLAAVCRPHSQGASYGNVCGYLKSATEPAFAESFSYAAPFSEGLGAVRLIPGGEMVYIDKSGKIALRFEEPLNLLPFQNGLATACLPGMSWTEPPVCRVIDSKGKVIWKAEPTQELELID